MHRKSYAIGKLLLNSVLSTNEIGRVFAGIALIYAKSATNGLSDGWDEHGMPRVLAGTSPSKSRLSRLSRAINQYESEFKEFVKCGVRSRPGEPVREVGSGRGTIKAIWFDGGFGQNTVCDIDKTNMPYYRMLWMQTSKKVETIALQSTVNKLDHWFMANNGRRSS
ncbi:hypothetical protein THAOC_35986 [Thalassiosira oceanica]|uniref:Uncharacterized protein n=1 Tax=Thalassiosira oceanica TaxID=159749 RepID=K0R944_THAOC|nr:hypothetical protein THAOC_35986 [Thalassiosira oceanica]|eukprot:EJK45401.1 hypothetical protein THAOC_35986 [Thalassiosira oceanica]